MEIVYKFFFQLQVFFMEDVADYLTTRELAFLPVETWGAIAKYRLYGRTWLLGGIVCRVLSILSMALAVCTFTPTPALAVSTALGSFFFADHANQSFRNFFMLHEAAVWMKARYEMSLE